MDFRVSLQGNWGELFHHTREEFDKRALLALRDKARDIIAAAMSIPHPASGLVEMRRNSFPIELVNLEEAGLGANLYVVVTGDFGVFKPYRLTEARKHIGTELAACLPGRRLRVTLESVAASAQTFAVPASQALRSA